MKITRKNYYEELIDQMMIEEVSGVDKKILETLESLQIEQKRLAILSILDKDRDLFIKLKTLIDNGSVTPDVYTKGIVEMLREYVGVSDVERKRFGEVMTPISLVDDMLDALPEEVWSNHNLRWLDPCNGVGIFPSVVLSRLMDGLSEWQPNEERRYRHIMENMLYVCELQPKNMFLFMCAFDPYDTYDMNVYTGSFLDQGFDDHMSEVWKVNKFDIIVGNPPYNQSMDLKFVTKLYDFSDNILFVHPSTWLLDEKRKQKKFNNLRDLIGNDLKYIKIFNGNGLFGIALFVPCAITYIVKGWNNQITLRDEINDKDVIYDNIYDINKYNTDEYLSLKTKIEDFNGVYINNHLKEEKTYWVNLAQIRGHVNLRNNPDFSMDTKMIKDDFYTLLTKNNTVEYNKREEREKTQFSFDTEQEANNFLNYIKTKFVRFCLSIYKNNANCHRGEINLIPWFDFTQEWTDEKLKTKFNITDKEWDFIESVIPDYY